ncbi:MAG TPA: hypothetical protein VGU73_07680, partial [Acidimicrobiia bacterium]|nr:hypothetical protein [Acidimicrobiia bacterium]
STPGPSVTCSAQLGVPGSGGICRSAGGEYAMLTIAPSTIVDISLHTARPVTETMLVALAQDAYAHNV